MNFYRFCLEGTGERLLNAVKNSLNGVQFFECSSYQESTVFIHLQDFVLKFKQTLSKVFG